MSAHGRSTPSAAANPDLARLQATLSGGFTAFETYRDVAPESQTAIDELLIGLPWELVRSQELWKTPGYRTSIIPPSQGGRFSLQWLNRFDELLRNLEGVVEELPDTIQGFAGKVCVLNGSPKDNRRLKYVALTLDDDLSATIQGERNTIIRAAKGHIMPSDKYKPHITIGKTDDPKKAKKLKLHLNRELSGLSGENRIPILLQTAQLSPLKRPGRRVV